MSSQELNPHIKQTEDPLTPYLRRHLVVVESNQYSLPGFERNLRNTIQEAQQEGFSLKQIRKIAKHHAARDGDSYLIDN